MLRKIGLTEGEIKVYSAILEIGIATVNRIHEKTGIERRNIYDILNKLIEKGLVSHITEKKKRVYQITHPNKILSYIEEKKYGLDKIKEEIGETLPSIIKKFESDKPKIRAEVYRGKEAFKALFEDTLNYKDIYFIGGGWYVMEKLPYYWASYNRRRIELGVKWHNLARHELRRRKPPETRLMYQKFLPKEFSGSPSVIFIYGNKVANVLWGEEFFAFMVESKEIAENHKRYFDFLWKISK